MRELPRKLTHDELAELFSGGTALVHRLAAEDDPLGAGYERALATLTDAGKAQALAAHPRIGEASPEQRGGGADVLAELAELNRAYETKFGFRFVVFVDGRTRGDLLPVLRTRLQRTRAQELETGLGELLRIARARHESR